MRDRTRARVRGERRRARAARAGAGADATSLEHRVSADVRASTDERRTERASRDERRVDSAVRAIAIERDDLRDASAAAATATAPGDSGPPRGVIPADASRRASAVSSSSPAI